MAAISQTPASVLQITTSGVSNSVGTGTAAVTIVAGNMVYNVSGTTTYALSDANVSVAKVPAGMALGGAAAGQPFFFQSAGTVNPGGTMTVGSMIYLSVTSGGITETYADIAAGEWSVPIGQALTASSLLIALNGQAVAKP